MIPFEIRRTWSAYLRSAVWLVFVAGCSSGVDGPPRYDCWGEVTYQGKPVRIGYVAFEPDSKSGNSGPGSITRIVDGHYRTPPGKGVVGGAYQIRITGYDGKTPDGLGDGNPLFAEVVIERDLPREDSEQTFNITNKNLGRN